MAKQRRAGQTNFASVLGASPFARSPNEPPHSTEVTAGASASIVELNEARWQSWRPAILEIEKSSFGRTIRDTPETLDQFARSKTSLFFAAVVTSRGEKIIGYVAADLLEQFADVPGVREDPNFGRNNTAYIASVAVHPAWRRRGVGLRLQVECLRRAAERKLQRVTAHVARGAVDRMQLSARILGAYSNWYQTGVTFEYIEMSTTGR